MYHGSKCQHVNMPHIEPGALCHVVTRLQGVSYTMQVPTPIAPGQGPVDPETLMTPTQREEFTRGVDKITSFPVDGEEKELWGSSRGALVSARASGHTLRQP